MTKLTHHIRSFALACAGLVATGGAFAQGTWDLDACVRGVAGACTSDGSTVSVSGYYSNGAASNFQLGTLNIGTDWMGVSSRNGSGTVETTSSPHHAIDNYSSSGASYAELVYLQFSKGVDLSRISSVWTNGATTGDFQFFRWNDGTTAPTITNFNAGAMTGWTQVAAGDFSADSTQDFNDGAYYSSHWLVTTKFGGSNDAFKLGGLIATDVCSGTGYTVNGSGACNPPGNPPGGAAPEPASLALFGVAALGAGFARRRARAKAA